MDALTQLLLMGYKINIACKILGKDGSMIITGNAKSIHQDNHIQAKSLGTTVEELADGLLQQIENQGDKNQTMNIKDLLKIDANNLKQKQYNELKNYAANKLIEIATFLIDDQLDEVEKNLMLSPAGDDMGTDRYFIDFGYDGLETDGHEEMDLNDIIHKLRQLKN